MHPLLKGFTFATRPPERCAPWEWCERHVVVDDTSPMPGRWRCANSPWVKLVMDCANIPHVRRIVVKCSAQSSKTQTILNIVCWAISEAPGPMLWVMAAKDEARDFMRDRVMPTLTNCKPVWGQLENVEGSTFVFHTMPFYLTGAHSKSKLQSKPIRWLLLDEVRNYPEGALQLALKRTRAFWNAKEFIISTPDKVGDDVDAEYKAGSQEELHVCCPKCGALQPLDFKRMTWSKEEEAKPFGQFDFERLADSIRFPCIACDHVWQDRPHERRQMARECRFIAQNPGAPRHRRSFTWNALIATWVSWKSVVEEYLSAMKVARQDPPDIEPLKAFYCETLGQSWEEALGIVDDFGALHDRKGAYDFNDPWPEERDRFIAADKQAEGGEHYWWLIRAFGPLGRSRLVAYGRAETLEQLEEIRVQYEVPIKNAMLDSGFRASEVYRWCEKSGWKPFKGDATDLYTATVLDPETKKPKTVRRLWHKSMVEPSFGTRESRRFAKRPSKSIPLYRFATDTVKDFLAEFILGIVGGWTVPATIGKDYFAQMTAERRVEKTDRRGRVSYDWIQLRKANHLWDCELMILAAAVITKLVQDGVVRAPKVHAGGMEKAA